MKAIALMTVIALATPVGKLPAGKKVEVEFVQQGEDYMITDAK